MTQPDRRHIDVMKDLIIPLVLALVVGVTSATLTVRVAVAVIETQMGELKGDVSDLKMVLGIVQGNQLAKTRIEIMTQDNSAEVIKIWDEINIMKRTAYTKEQAERDIQILRLEAKARHNESIDRSE